MEHNYNTNNIDDISSLFNKMIKEYPNEYEKIISFDKNCISEYDEKNDIFNKAWYYERLVFNQSDLIPKAFQFLDFLNINNCSLVNSIWLYHGYNINSIYYFDTQKLFFRKRRKIVRPAFEDACDWIDPNFECKRRFLTRLVNVRKLRYVDCINIFGVDKSLFRLFIQQFKKMQKIEFIDVRLAKYNMDEQGQMIDLISQNMQ